jgi:hypothetical protein
VRLRITKICQHAVAQIFRYEPVEAANGLGEAFLIGRDDLAQVLWVHAGGERRRTDKVAEHDGDLAALGVSVDCRNSVAWRDFRARVSAQGGDGVEQLTAVSNNAYAEILQVLCRQARQDRLVDRILAECRLILSEVKAPQPTSEVHIGSLTSPGTHDRPGETTCPVH